MSIELILIPIAIAISGSISNRRKSINVSQPEYRCPTIIRDASLLQEGLELLGCRSITTGASVTTDLQGNRILFERSEAGTFDAVFIGPIPETQANEFVKNLHDDVLRLTQQHVYERLMQRAKERGFELEREEVLADQSVVLTFRV